jgi:hypothetical protein
LLVDEIKDNMIIIEGEEEKTFTEFIKYLYTGSLDTESDEEISKMFLLMNKVKYFIKNPKYSVKNLGDLKIPSTLLLKKLIQDTQSNIKEKLPEFEILIENIRYYFIV